MWAETRPLDVPQPRKHRLTNGVLPQAGVDLHRRRGGGGSGLVYRATERSTGKVLAVKVLRDDKLDHCEGLLREARILRQIDSPWVVRFERSGMLPDGRPWFAMEYLEGRSLARIISSRDCIDIPQVIDWLRQACRGLAAIHDAGWAHRDVKPSNLVCVGKPGHRRVVVVDLGIAARFGDRPSVLSGTPDYIAPEQAQSKPVDLRSDIYALGCCAYELLTGRSLVTLSGALAKINAHIEGVEVTWPEEQAVPYVLRRIVERCLARAPEARPPNMHELEAELGRAAQELERRRRRTSMPAPAFTPCDVTTVVRCPVVAANDEPKATPPRSAAALVARPCKRSLWGWITRWHQAAAGAC